MDCFKLLEQFSKASDLPVSVFEHGNLVLKGHSDKQDYNIPMFLLESLPADLPEIWVSRTPERLFFGGLSIKKQLLILGPVSSYECSISQCEQILRRLGRKPYEAGTFQKIIGEFALCNILQLRNYLSFLNYVLNEEEDAEIVSVDFKWKDVFSVPEEYVLEMPPESEDDVEDSILVFIRNGRVEELENYFNEVFYENSPLEKNTRNLNIRRNYIIGANIHFSRIAIQAGVDAGLARNLSGHYLDLLMQSNNLTDLNNIFYRMAVEYTKKVRSVRAFASEDMLPRRVNSSTGARWYWGGHGEACWAARSSICMECLDMMASPHRIIWNTNRLLLIPNYILMSKEASDMIRMFVQNGGTAVMTGYSAMVDISGKVFDVPRPGSLSDVFGLRVAGFDRNTGEEAISGSMGKVVFECQYREHLELHTAKCFAEFGDGMCAVSENRFGNGKAYYAATDTRSEVLGLLFSALGYKGAFSVPEGVRVRKIADGQHFYVNMFGKEAKVPLIENGYGVLSEKEQAGTLILPPFEAELVVSRQPTMNKSA